MDNYSVFIRRPLCPEVVSQYEKDNGVSVYEIAVSGMDDGYAGEFDVCEDGTICNIYRSGEGDEAETTYLRELGEYRGHLPEETRDMAEGMFLEYLLAISQP